MKLEQAAPRGRSTAQNVRRFDGSPKVVDATLRDIDDYAHVVWTARQPADRMGAEQERIAKYKKILGARRASPNTNQQLSEISAGQHSDERLRRRFEALDNIFAIANAPRCDECTDFP